MNVPVPDRADNARYRFARLACEVSHPGGGPAWCRLAGREQGERQLLLDFAGARIEPRPPARLDAVQLVQESEAPSRWQLQSAQGQFTIHDARLFVHEDLGVRAAATIPPRPVPMAKRAFWRLVFALLSTSFGRRWLERRASRST